MYQSLYVSACFDATAAAVVVATIFMSRILQLHLRLENDDVMPQRYCYSCISCGTQYFCVYIEWADEHVMTTRYI